MRFSTDIMKNASNNLPTLALIAAIVTADMLYITLIQYVLFMFMFYAIKSNWFLMRLF